MGKNTNKIESRCYTEWTAHWTILLTVGIKVKWKRCHQ